MPQNTQVNIDRTRKSLITDIIGEDKVLILSSQDNVDLSTVAVQHEGQKVDLSKKNVYIFAEGLSLHGGMLAKKAIIYANTLYMSKDKTIDVSGQQGQSGISVPISSNNNESTINGHNGSDAGNVLLYVEDIINTMKNNSWFSIHAIGGVGGAGASGGISQKGGNGGDGGKGGNVKILVINPYKTLLKSIEDILENENLSDKKGKFKCVSEQIIQGKAYTSLPDTIKKHFSDLSKDIDTKTTGQINSDIIKIYSALDSLMTNWTIQQKSNISVKGGDYGVYGSGTPNGRNGKTGPDGSSDVSIKESGCSITLQELLPREPHLEQIAMVLNKAKLKYIFQGLTDNINQDRLIEVVDLLQRVKIRTDSCIKLKDNFEEENLNQKNPTMIKYNTEAKTYLKQLGTGLDFFGYKKNEVPVISIKLIKQYLEELSNNFSTIDDAYENYLRKENDKEDRKQYTNKIFNSVNAQISNINHQINSLYESIDKKTDLINQYQNILAKQKDKMNVVIAEYDQKIKGQIQNLQGTTFNPDIKTLLGSLSMIAFAPQSKFMIGVQAAEFIHDSTSNITLPTGERVRKEFLVNKLTTIQGDLQELDEEFSKSNTIISLDYDRLIKLNPEGNKLLVVEQGKLNDSLKEFYKLFPQEIDYAKNVKKAMNNYVDIVTKRNSQILDYNNYVTLLTKKVNSKEDLSQQKQKIKDQELQAVDNIDSDLTRFISDAYYVVRDEILYTINLVDKAYKFWTLDNQGIVSSIIYKNDTIDITKETVELIKSNLTSNLLRHIINNPTVKSKFTQSYIIDDEDSLSRLSDNGLLSVAITHSGPNSIRLDGLSDARVSHIYPCIHGIKFKNKDNQLEDGDLRIKITHGGENNFSIYANFNHKPITKYFEYHLKAPEFKYKTNNILDKSSITVEPNFEVPGAEDSISYAILSPFTTWEIDTLPDVNQGLDLTGVTSIELVFEGTCCS